MTATREQFPALGLEVPISAIESELKRLWEADQASTNASLMNLAVYSEDPRSLERNSEAIQALTREHACRAILIGMDRAAAEVAVTAWITAHCHLAHGRKSVCCEQLAFLLEGKAMGRLRNTVFAHLASDLPLVFWWQGELSDLFEPELYRRIDRLVFDSTEWSDLQAGYEQVRAAAEDVAHGIVLQDLAWTRSFYFRVAVAGLFDDLVAQRALPEISEVRVVAQPSQRATALLLLAWLATQAGWELSPTSGEGERFAFVSREGTGIVAELAWDREGAPLSRLELRAPDCEVVVSRDAGAVHLQQRLKSPSHELVRSGPAGGEGPVALVADQLSRGGRNELLRKVWPVFFAMLALG